MSDDLYKILGIRHDADDKEVRSAYRRLARRYHPDTGKGSSGEKFRAVQHAYDVLGDAGQRAAYDRERERPPRRTMHPEPPRWDPFTGVHRPQGVHIDLSHLGRRPAAERIEFARPDSARREADIWDELIAYLFRGF